jgi:hypothetical protein
MAKKKVRLVFLDIDGVCNSVRTATAYGGYPFPRTEYNQEGTRMEQIFSDPPIKKPESIDRVSVDLLSKVIRDTEAYIVWSTTWRLGLGLRGITELARHLGLEEERVLGRTFDLSGPDSCRGTEIRHFIWCLTSATEGCTPQHLIKHGYLNEKLAKALSPDMEFEVEHYVIVDDSRDMLVEQRPHFVNTNPDNGFMYKDYVETGNILRGEPREKGRFLMEEWRDEYDEDQSDQPDDGHPKVYPR